MHEISGIRSVMLKNTRAYPRLDCSSLLCDVWPAIAIAKMGGTPHSRTALRHNGKPQRRKNLTSLRRPYGRSTAEVMGDTQRTLAGARA